MKNWNQEQIMTLCSFTADEYHVHMAFRCSKLKIIIFQSMNKRGESFMRNLLAFVSYTLAAMSGICFVSGIAILSTGKEQ